DLSTRLGIAELIAAYGDCIDDDRLEEWRQFFVHQIHYLLNDGESHEAGLKHGVIYCASRGMLVAGVTSLRRLLMYEAHRYRHLVGPTRIMSLDGKIAETRSNF